MAKLSKEAKLRALALAETLICKGRPSRNIQSALRDEFGITSRNAREYIRKARERLASAFRDKGENPDAVRAQGEAMLEQAYALAKRNGDSKAMQSATVTMLQLHGVAPVAKVDLSVSGIADMLSEVLHGSPGNDPKPDTTS